MHAVVKGMEHEAYDAAGLGTTSKKKPDDTSNGSKNIAQLGVIVDKRNREALKKTKIQERYEKGILRRN